jgi:hypothetical protein
MKLNNFVILFKINSFETMTKNGIILLLVFLICSCESINRNEKTNIGSDSSKVEITSPNDKIDTLKSDTLSLTKIQKPSNWVDSFREFRNALYQGDKPKVKQFFDFPILNKNNDIWNLAYTDIGIPKNTSYGKPVPFTEKEFDKNYKRIFSKYFIKSILKIKTEKLFNNGEYQTEKFKDGNLFYYSGVRFDKETKTVNITLYFESPIIENDGSEDTLIYSESTWTYVFDLVDGKFLKFREIWMAG